MRTFKALLLAALLANTVAVPALLANTGPDTVAVRGETVYTMAGEAIHDGVVVVTDGKVTAVGPAASVDVPAGVEVLEAKVVTPGLVDAHSVVGLAGWLNYNHDQDQLERSSPIQPELRAFDAYNAREPLVEWVRGFGVTTLHTGHGPGALISGQTMVVKTRGGTVSEALVRDAAMVAATLGAPVVVGEGKSPGTRAKAVAMLRAEFIKAREYREKLAEGKGGKASEDGERVPRDLRLETLARVLDGTLPLLVTADRHSDIATALRLQEEFGFRLVLDSAAESYQLLDEIRAAGVPVIVHPTMKRAHGETENLSLETAATLADAGIPVALQSGFENYVPKTRVVLFEAAVAAANGLGFERALASITIDAARILGVDDRVGSIEVGKDGDLALYDGDPFEYTTHCVGVVIDGAVVHREAR